MTENNIQTDDINLLRSQIDEIDAQIAHLLVKRTQISQAVAFSKISDAKNTNQELSFGWRPKREVEILRLIRQKEPSLGKRLSYMIWRAMITRNLANQAPMEVVCVKETEAPSRIGFGAAVNPQVLENCDEAIKQAEEKENLIVSLPWPGGKQNWWLKLIEPQYQNLKVNMALPHIEDKKPEALCLAKITPLETGNDYSLIITKDNKALVGVAISRANGYCLWHLKGFHAHLAQQEDVYFIGSYAIV